MRREERREREEEQTLDRESGQREKRETEKWEIVERKKVK